MDYSKTGRLIAKKRKDLDYTLEDLSKLLGVSPQAIMLMYGKEASNRKQ
ncbi:MAG: helix-turn-helix domain-containing protein [Anaerolineaceae bacterium]|nr:helix-turn-helix domain-containing protein [Anaerolineaceae bacterium]